MELCFEAFVRLDEASDKFRVAVALEIKALPIVLVHWAVGLITPPVTEGNTGFNDIAEGFHYPGFGSRGIIVALEVIGRFIPDFEVGFLNGVEAKLADHERLTQTFGNRHVAIVIEPNFLALRIDDAVARLV